jgi:hypothetical protein
MKAQFSHGALASKCIFLLYLDLTLQFLSHFRLDLLKENPGNMACFPNVSWGIPLFWRKCGICQPLESQVGSRFTRTSSPVPCVCSTHERCVASECPSSRLSDHRGSSHILAFLSFLSSILLLSTKPMFKWHNCLCHFINCPGYPFFFSQR